jgi:hypothetical protein
MAKSESFHRFARAAAPSWAPHQGLMDQVSHYVWKYCGSFDIRFLHKAERIRHRARRMARKLLGVRGKPMSEETKRRLRALQARSKGGDQDDSALS